MDYRNDLAASRLRITTLEAKLEESKAALEVRDAELAEYKAERDRLRKTATVGPTRPQLFRYLVLAFVAGSGVTLAFVIIFGRFTGTVSLSPPEKMTKYEGPKVEGRANVPPPESRPPAAKNEGHADVPKEEPREPTAKNEGHADVPKEEPRDPWATVAGQTDAPTTEPPTIQSVIDGARPKLRVCYNKELVKHPDVAGSLNVLFDIEPSGKASRVELSGILRSSEPWWSQEFATCVSDVYRKLTFPTSGESKTTAKGTYFFSALDRDR